ncbi:hypothetical protein DIURU_005122 [Diutina rugosa]|uniref:Very-long-chain (3R)-3-hydroxyacyl-CoA dehydratase n=1 Tax=Diutina rugosa TaxID=5481 RepID=A0A642UES3_DIURU|nr:uncharacterized protein DIURU_005122 [Diutina rugosa]KAA8897691.1 hypothetical protein DIURU_005122 [Diutina rugosa]
MARMVSASLNKGLIAYNSISASLWMLVLFITVVLGGLGGQPLLFDKTSWVLIAVQSLAIIEVYNAATGIVRSPIFTTAMQVASRLLIVWGICYFNKSSPANRSVAYITLTLAWSVTEIIRYSYYAHHLRDPQHVPRWLLWLRYTTFYVLYPLGVASECYMIWATIPYVGTATKALFWVVLLAYIPGFYTLFTYMIKQRKKALNKEKEY